MRIAPRIIVKSAQSFDEALVNLEGPASKWPIATILRHVKTNGLYIVKATPNMIRLEADAVPAYLYRGVDSEGVEFGPCWTRAQTEMEDGRFVVVP